MNVAAKKPLLSSSPGLGGEGWEYCMLEIVNQYVVSKQIGTDPVLSFGARTGPLLSAEMSAMAAQGWELSGAMPIDFADPGNYFVIFKRLRFPARLKATA